MGWALLGVLIFICFFNVRLSLFTLLLIYIVWYGYAN